MRATLVCNLLLVSLASASCVSFSACRATDTAAPRESTQPDANVDQFATARSLMVAQQIAARGVADPRVLAAMRKVPRHEFVATAEQTLAYTDRPLPIARDQTISQPYIVALMTELAAVSSDSKVLEIGTGSGYQAAVLAEVAKHVYTIEIIAELAESAARKLAQLGYDNVHVRHGDGYQGWPENAPFDAIVVTAAPPQVPKPLRQQLAVGGRLIIPVGTRYQELRVIERTPEGFTETSVLPVQFVPMTDSLR